LRFGFESIGCKAPARKTVRTSVVRGIGVTQTKLDRSKRLLLDLRPHDLAAEPSDHDYLRVVTQLLRPVVMTKSGGSECLLRKTALHSVRGS
jgi:hypothetical protein